MKLLSLIALVLLTGCATPVVDLPALLKDVKPPPGYCPLGTVKTVNSCQTVQHVRIEDRHGRKATQRSK
jgi:hypothetical protein